MNDILKQRLVGALILLALGVVFWPIIFVEPGERYTLEESRIPTAPTIDTTPIDPPSQEGLRGSPEWEIEDIESGQVDDEGFGAILNGPAPVREIAPQLAQEEVEAEPEPAAVRGTRAQAPVSPTLDSNGLPVAWILQVVSVSNAAKADELRDQLLAMREKAYVKKLKRGDKNLYRVYIGPNVERAQLEQIQAGIDKRFGVSSIIVRYIP